MDLLERLQLLSAATAPPILLGVMFYILSQRTLPPDMRDMGFVAGAFSAVAILPVAVFLEEFFPHRGFPGPIEAFVKTGLVEETSKFAFLMLMVLRHYEARVRRDAMLAGIWIGLGFGALENISYLIDSSRWATIGVARAVSAVPFHAALGAIMGLVVQRTGGHPAWWPVALGIPVALHGSYNWGAFVIDDPFDITGLSAEGGLVLFSATVAVASLFVVGPVASAIRALNRGSPTLPVTPLPAWAVPLGSIVAAVFVLAAIAALALGLSGWQPLWKNAILMIPASAMPLAFAILWWRAHPRAERQAAVLPAA